MSQRLLRLPKVLDLAGFSRSTLYRKVGEKGENGFPAPVTLGSRMSLWVESEVVDWINQQIERPRNARPCIVQRATERSAQ